MPSTGRISVIIGISSGASFSINMEMSFWPPVFPRGSRHTIVIGLEPRLSWKSGEWEYAVEEDGVIISVIGVCPGI